jgi:hypothetical protein
MHQTNPRFRTRGLVWGMNSVGRRVHFAHQFHLCFDKSKKSRFQTERAAFGATPQVHGVHLLVEPLQE